MYILENTTTEQVFNEIFEDQGGEVSLSRLCVGLLPKEGVVTNKIVELEGGGITLQLISEREFCVSCQERKRYFHLNEYEYIVLHDFEAQSEKYSISDEGYMREEAKIIGKKVTLPAGTFDVENLEDLAARILELCDYEVDRG